MSKEVINQVPIFKVGDKVDFTNDYGVCFPNRTIVGIDYWDGDPRPRYFMQPSGNPEHYSSKEANFKLTPVKPVSEVEEWS